LIDAVSAEDVQRVAAQYLDMNGANATYVAGALLPLDEAPKAFPVQEDAQSEGAE
jgi:hypothetical protein